MFVAEFWKEYAVRFTFQNVELRTGLIHVQVLLGEGYYAERTSKQTVEILKRRGKALDSQVDSLKAMMDDLKAEASFFDATASEAAVSLAIYR